MRLRDEDARKKKKNHQRKLFYDIERKYFATKKILEIVHLLDH